MRKPANNHHSHERYRGKVAGAYADPLPIPRRKKVTIVEVACPDCRAEVGDRTCFKADGTPVQSAHTARKRMATRLDNERREAEGTLVAPVHRERVPGPLEDPQGPECPYCGLRLRTLPDPHAERLLLPLHTTKGTRPSGPKHRACPGSHQPTGGI